MRGLKPTLATPGGNFGRQYWIVDSTSVFYNDTHQDFLVTAFSTAYVLVYFVAAQAYEAGATAITPYCKSQISWSDESFFCLYFHDLPSQFD